MPSRTPPPRAHKMRTAGILPNSPQRLPQLGSGSGAAANAPQTVRPGPVSTAAPPSGAYPEGFGLQPGLTATDPDAPRPSRAGWPQQAQQPPPPQEFPPLAATPGASPTRPERESAPVASAGTMTSTTASKPVPSQARSSLLPAWVHSDFLAKLKPTTKADTTTATPAAPYPVEDYRPTTRVMYSTKAGPPPPPSRFAGPVDLHNRREYEETPAAPPAARVQEAEAYSPPPQPPLQPSSPMEGDDFEERLPARVPSAGYLNHSLFGPAPLIEWVPVPGWDDTEMLRGGHGGYYKADETTGRHRRVACVRQGDLSRPLTATLSGATTPVLPQPSPIHSGVAVESSSAAAAASADTARSDAAAASREDEAQQQYASAVRPSTHAAAVTLQPGDSSSSIPYVASSMDASSIVAQDAMPPAAPVPAAGEEEVRYHALPPENARDAEQQTDYAYAEQRDAPAAAPQAPSPTALEATDKTAPPCLFTALDQPDFNPTLVDDNLHTAMMAEYPTGSYVLPWPTYSHRHSSNTTNGSDRPTTGRVYIPREVALRKSLPISSDGYGAHGCSVFTGVRRDGTVSVVLLDHYPDPSLFLPDDHQPQRHPSPSSPVRRQERTWPLPSPTRQHRSFAQQQQHQQQQSSPAKGTKSPVPAVTAPTSAAVATLAVATSLTDFPRLSTAANAAQVNGVFSLTPPPRVPVSRLPPYTQQRAAGNGGLYQRRCVAATAGCGPRRPSAEAEREATSTTTAGAAAASIVAVHGQSSTTNGFLATAPPQGCWSPLGPTTAPAASTALFGSTNPNSRHGAGAIAHSIAATLYPPPPPPPAVPCAAATGVASAPQPARGPNPDAVAFMEAAARVRGGSGGASSRSSGSRGGPRSCGPPQPPQSVQRSLPTPAAAASTAAASHGSAPAALAVNVREAPAVPAVPAAAAAAPAAPRDAPHRSEGVPDFSHRYREESSSEAGTQRHSKPAERPKSPPSLLPAWCRALADTLFKPLPATEAAAAPMPIRTCGYSTKLSSPPQPRPSSAGVRAPQQQPQEPPPPPQRASTPATSRTTVTTAGGSEMDSKLWSIETRGGVPIGWTLKSVRAAGRAAAAAGGDGAATTQGREDERVLLLQDDGAALLVCVEDPFLPHLPPSQQPHLITPTCALPCSVLPPNAAAVEGANALFLREVRQVNARMLRAASPITTPPLPDAPPQARLATADAQRETRASILTQSGHSAMENVNDVHAQQQDQQQPEQPPRTEMQPAEQQLRHSQIIPLSAISATVAPALQKHSNDDRRPLLGTSSNSAVAASALFEKPPNVQVQPQQDHQRSRHNFDLSTASTLSQFQQFHQLKHCRIRTAAAGGTAEATETARGTGTAASTVTVTAAVTTSVPCGDAAGAAAAAVAASSAPRSSRAPHPSVGKHKAYSMLFGPPPPPSSFLTHSGGTGDTADGKELREEVREDKSGGGGGDARCGVDGGEDARWRPSPSSSSVYIVQHVVDGEGGAHRPHVAPLDGAGNQNRQSRSGTACMPGSHDSTDITSANQQQEEEEEASAVNGVGVAGEVPLRGGHMPRKPPNTQHSSRRSGRPLVQLSGQS